MTWEIRTLLADEIDDVWSIDRTEDVGGVYAEVDGALVLRAERHAVRGWPAGEPERDGPRLRECLEHGGTAFGAFSGGELIGAVVLESRFGGEQRDWLQLKFLHVSHAHRGTGLGRTLFERAAGEARARGARHLYVSATPTENTVDFYRRRGCRLARERDPQLFALEPEDIHLELELDPAGD